MHGNPRRQNLLRRRKRVEDEGEDEESLPAGDTNDTQSEATIPSDVDQDGDADDSDLSEPDLPGSLGTEEVTGKANGAVKGDKPTQESSVEPSLSQPGGHFTVIKDTETMMNGLKFVDPSSQAEPLDFDNMGTEGFSGQTGAGADTIQEETRQDTITEKRRREHEEYKRKRDTDPTFIPNRGAFFMHDPRTAATGQNGFRPFIRGGGRGRNGAVGPFAGPSTLGPRPPEPLSAPWAHDLHETLMETDVKPSRQQAQQHIASNVESTQAGANAIDKAPNNIPPVRSFSTTKLLGKASVRVVLPGMTEPKYFHDIEIRQYAKLPNHRPPLRRDKPVRIALPGLPQARYIFPSTDRSFIFIPRALRPNQQGFGKGRGRPFGSLGGFSSRRTSIYGGSVYSPSVAMSRRSSIAREFNRDALMSPSLPAMTGKPVVRLPPGSQQHTAAGTPLHSATISGSGTPVMNFPPQVYPPPQKPPLRENWPANMPMHQPRPQKAVSVAGIESPTSPPFQPLPPPPPPPQEQQPFHQQVPHHMDANVPRSEPSTFYPPGQQIPYSNQVNAGTPLSNIPERAIHAQPFQPFTHQNFQPTFTGQPAYYYPSSNSQQAQYPSATVITPMFVPNGQQGGGYLVPALAPSQAQQVQTTVTSAGQSQMVAYEQNGTVYYYDPSQPYMPAENFQQPNYAMPGMGGLMTPAPEGFYYPQMPTGMYYPPQ